MSDLTAFYISLAAIAAFIVGGVHLLGHFMRPKDG